MIKANELRIGNLLIWNPKLTHPNNTLPPMQIEVSSILPDRISYVFPNIKNRVEPFEDDVVQAGVRFKLLEELEPITLTAEILRNVEFEAKDGLLTSKLSENGDVQLQFNEEGVERVLISRLNSVVFDLPIKYFHHLQNLFFSLTGEELDMRQPWLL